MKKVIAVMALLVSGVVAGAYQLYQFVPVPIATAVISEKPGKTMGGTNAVLLPETLSDHQARLLNSAYTTAKDVGFKNPEVVQAILLQETKAGGMKTYKVANAGPEAYFGPMQVKLAATRDVLAKHPTLWQKYGFQTKTDDEVKANLILNEQFNIEVGARYLMILQTQYGYTGKALMMAYNKGAGGVEGAGTGYADAATAKLAAYKKKS